MLVIGAGNSAGEIAAELSTAGARVTIAVRSGARVVPRDLLGVPIQYLAVAISRLPRHVQRSIAGATARMTLSDLSVRRPVLATVFSLIIIAFGAIAFATLPLREPCLRSSA